MTSGQSLSRVAAVTGAARGIGFEIARQLVGAGHRVALLDIEGEALTQAWQALGGAGSNTLPVKSDVTQAAETRVVIDGILEALGPVEILVNCAGWTPHRRFVELDEADARRIVDINYIGVMNMTRAVLPAMMERGWGRIINIGSDAARVGTPGEAVYAGAKAAVMGFTKSLCAEVARSGVTVNVVCPGTTDTPLLHAALSPEQIARRAAANPTGRIGQPEDVASVVLFFASDASGYVNGQTISVSGGMTRVG